MPLLTTKLHSPPVRPQRVSRPRLIERLNAGPRSGRKITLISAPAGFGKTTLVSHWVAGCERPIAWLSLDEGDNDPTRILTYVVAASRSSKRRSKCSAREASVPPLSPTSPHGRESAKGIDREEA